MSVKAANFQTSSLARLPQGALVRSVLAAAIQAVEPANAIHQHLRRVGKHLLVADRKYDLTSYSRIACLAIGKAAAAMSAAVAEILGERLTESLVVSKQALLKGEQATSGRFQAIQGGHPVPDANSLQAGEYALQLCRSLSEEDLLICLISGGGSALLTRPADGIVLADMQALTALLLASGARIDEINTLRRHLDLVKGGGIARAAVPAQVISLILSDVVNSPLEAIASGPTAADPSSRQEALDVLAKYNLINKVAPAILQTLKNGAETLKPGDAFLERVQNVLVGDNRLAALAAGAAAQSGGLQVIQLGNDWQGEAREVAVRVCSYLQTDNRRGICWIAGGETTVTLHGKGKGGRNQELALAAVDLLAGLPDVMLVTLATDGEDGPTDAAGAVVTGETHARAHALGLEADNYLGNNDAYHYFEKLGDLLKPGPSGTNVNDLTFMFRF